MAEKFRVGITRDNLKPDGTPIFDQAALKHLDDPRIEWEFLPLLEAELTPGTAAKYDALAVMLAKVTRQTVSGPNGLFKRTIAPGRATLSTSSRPSSPN